MTEPNPKIAAFFEASKLWAVELAALRAILLAAPLTEDFKWRAPCYTLQNRNVATLWRLKDNAALAFFKGALLADPEAVLIAPGENSRAMRVVKFTSLAQIDAAEPTLTHYIHNAIGLETAGQTVDFTLSTLAIPQEFAGKLAVDPALAAAFSALTPGRQRGYLLHFAQPTQSKTRLARIEKASARIFDGKGLQDR